MVIEINPTQLHHGDVIHDAADRPMATVDAVFLHSDGCAWVEMVNFFPVSYRAGEKIRVTRREAMER